MPASTGNWPTAKGRATKPLQNHPKTSKSPAEEKQTQKHRWAIRCISPFATGVYCLLDSCIPHESSPQIFGPVSNWQVQPNVADEHLGWRKDHEQPQNANLEGRKPSTQTVWICVCPSFWGLNWSVSSTFENEGNEDVQKPNPGFHCDWSVWIVERIHWFSAWNLSPILNSNNWWTQHLKLNKQKFTILKEGFASSHMSVGSTIPMPILHREESTLRIWMCQE